MFLRKSPACIAGAVVALALTSRAVLAGSGEVTLVHTGDIHGHMVPRPNVRSDGNGQLEGGLARLYKDMVAKSAWLATKTKATPKVLRLRANG